MTAVTLAAIRTNFCATCYLSGIDRLCDGFTITYSTGKKVVAVPPLDRNLAADVRKAAQLHIERHGPGDNKNHPRHAGATR